MREYRAENIKLSHVATTKEYHDIDPIVFKCVPGEILKHSFSII